MSSNYLNSLHQWDPAEFESLTAWAGWREILNIHWGASTPSCRRPPPGTKQDCSPSSPQNKVKNISGRVMGKAQTKNKKNPAPHGLLFFIWSLSCDKTGYREQARCRKSTFFTLGHKWWSKAGSNRDASLLEGYIFQFMRECLQGLEWKESSYFHISTCQGHNLVIVNIMFSFRFNGIKSTY